MSIRTLFRMAQRFGYVRYIQPASWIHSRINERATVAQQLAPLPETVSFQMSGMDCDCVKYDGSEQLLKPTVVEAWRRIESFYEAAEGPCWCWFSEPVEDHYESHDRALEAFEEGHPHMIRW